MNCQEAETLMMGYMDGTLTEKQSELLHFHINNCSTCMEAFQIYDSLMNSFDEQKEAETIQAPFGFESRVMERLKKEQAVILISPVKKMILIAFSILWMIGWGLIFFGRSLMEICSGIPLLSIYLQKMVVIQERIYSQGIPGFSNINAAFVQLNEWLSQSTVVVAVVLVSLCLLQAFLVLKRHTLRNKR